MSIWAKTWAYKQHPKRVAKDDSGQKVVSGKKHWAAKAVLVALAEYPGPGQRVCWPSQATLADMTDLGEREVRKCLHDLEFQGLIKRTMRKRKDGTRRSDMVELLGPDAEFGPPQDADEPSEERPKNQPEHSAGGGGKPTGTQCRDNRNTVPNQPEHSAGHEPQQRTAIEPSSEEKTSFSSGDDAANADAAPLSESENSKPVSYRAYCHKRARELVKEAKQQSYAPDTLPDKTVNEWSAFYESAITRDGYSKEQCDAAIWWLIRKASGAIEGEPQGWAAFGTGLRAALAEQDEAPNAQTELEKKRLEKENAEIDEMAREAARLMQQEFGHG